MKKLLHEIQVELSNAMEKSNALPQGVDEDGCPYARLIDPFSIAEDFDSVKAWARTFGWVVDIRHLDAYSIVASPKVLISKKKFFDLEEVYMQYDGTAQELLKAERVVVCWAISQVISASKVD